jgi:hypothetical protein
MVGVSPLEDIPPLDEPLIVRMALEGIPVRAAARCTKFPSDKVRDVLLEAFSLGTIAQMPRDDWSPLLTRDKRVPEYAKTGVDDALLILNVVRLFGVTQQQACLLLVLIKRREVTRKMLHAVIESRRPHPKVETEPKIVDVVICKLRKKLEPLGLRIETVWSCGYFMSEEHRKTAMGMLNALLDHPNAIVLEEGDPA